MATYKKVIGNYQSNADFSPDLVGFQIVEGQFTNANFYTTPTPTGKSTVFYQTEGFAQPVTLNDLNITTTQTSTMIDNNLKLVLNIDESDIFNYTLFGSLREHIKSSVKKVIRRWPGSLYMNKNASGTTRYTAIEYVYDETTNSSRFMVPVPHINNKFNINIKNSPDLNQSSSGVKLMAQEYYQYVLRYPIRVGTGSTINATPGAFSSHQEFPVLAFTGTSDSNPNYIHFRVTGNPFTGATPYAIGGHAPVAENFHIKPSNKVVESFFTSLQGLDRFLLNRDKYPIYTSEFTIPVETDSGAYIDKIKKFTWSISDGYNIDINTVSYGMYLEGLLSVADSYDNYKTDLVSRFFVTDAIKEFDTGERKVQKLLRIYGREFDEVKKYIDGLAFATRVSYDKNDNIPDKLVKNFARTLGFETIDFIDQTDLLESFFGGTQTPVFSGTSVGMTPVEFDIELWRRLVINAGYLFRSKGTRKVIEFLLRFIGAPKSLIEFNEYVYTVKGKLDINRVTSDLSLLVNSEGGGGFDDEETDQNAVAGVNLDIYPIDDEGYPSPLDNSDTYYFQNNGGWYRETNFIGANNPHIGPYDGGQDYFNKFRCFTDSSGGTVTVPSEVSGTVDVTQLVPILVSNQANQEFLFNTIIDTVPNNGLGYVNGMGNTVPGNTGLGASWTTVNDALNFGPAALYVFDHPQETMPPDKEILAKNLYDAGYAVLTMSEYSTNTLYPISSSMAHQSGADWGYFQNTSLDPLNPLSQNWTNIASQQTTPGQDITNIAPEAHVLSYNNVAPYDKPNILYMYNTNGGRWVHIQNFSLNFTVSGAIGGTTLLNNIMDFLTMRTPDMRTYFDFSWADHYEQTRYIPCPGFTLFPQIDNKKSWTDIESSSIDTTREWSIKDQPTTSLNTNRDTKYFVGDDERLVLNTKMVDAHLNPARAIEYDMYHYNKQYGFPIAKNFEYYSQNYVPTMGDPATPGTDVYMVPNLWPGTRQPNPYMNPNTDPLNDFSFYYGSQLSGASFTVSGTTFAQYIDRVKTKFINVKNRKTIGGGGFGFQPNWPAYPTLRNLYEAYVSGGTHSTSTGVVTYPFPSNELTYKKMLGFVDKIEPFWSKLIEQFIPATTIIGLGTRHTNTVFDKQKFVYKHGHSSMAGITGLAVREPNIVNSTAQTNKTGNRVRGSQWYNKTIIYAGGIGPDAPLATETAPLTLRVLGANNNTVPAAEVLLVGGRVYTYKISVNTYAGLENWGNGSGPGSQQGYSIGGYVGSPLAMGVVGGVQNLPPAGLGYLMRDGKIFIKKAISATEDKIIDVFGPGIYEGAFTYGGATGFFQISTNINGLILNSIELYDTQTAAYVIDNSTRNGNFTDEMEYVDAGSPATISRMKYWYPDVTAPYNVNPYRTWKLWDDQLQIWPGSDGTESVSWHEDYCKGVLPCCEIDDSICF